MPFKSKAQRRLAYAVLEGKSDAMPKDVADRFVKHDTKKNLPEKVKRAKT